MSNIFIISDERRLWIPPYQVRGRLIIALRSHEKTKGSHRETRKAVAISETAASAFGLLAVTGERITSLRSQ
jgi:hypothetical protein